MIDNRNYLGETIKGKRKEMKMSQETLAEKAETTQPRISKIERGVADPSFQLICDIARALECSPLDFCTPEMGFKSEYKLTSEDGALVMSIALRKRDKNNGGK